MTESRILPENAVEGAFARMRKTARFYDEAFPVENRNLYLAHLAVAATGTALSQAVERYLSTNFGINRARYSLLRALYFADGHREPQSELARTLNVTSPNVTQLIDALEREGLVEREGGDSDRRVTYARLTPSGAARCDELVPAMAGFMVKTCAGLSDEELDTLVNILSKLRSHLEREVD
ncbi:MAG TPA: MarR family transcriptional regulator [Dehalococcoidia bacterium]|jgi:MarR family 2-MHQ and catechol resistance regulon transcriptional repressor